MQCMEAKNPGRTPTYLVWYTRMKIVKKGVPGNWPQSKRVQSKKGGQQYTQYSDNARSAR